jgi:hypothetical protein
MHTVDTCVIGLDISLLNLSILNDKRIALASLVPKD